jgi:hypothetical protein
VFFFEKRARIMQKPSIHAKWFLPALPFGAEEKTNE